MAPASTSLINSQAVADYFGRLLWLLSNYYILHSIAGNAPVNLLPHPPLPGNIGGIVGI